MPAATNCLYDWLRGKTRPAHIFVAVMGASNFTYAEASWTQALADWIGAHIRAFEAIGSVPQLLVPDKTQVALIKACLYEPLSVVHFPGAGQLCVALCAADTCYNLRAER
jgi:transposase